MGYFKLGNGIIWNLGIQYGRQTHDVNVTYKSLDFFDTINKESLESTTAQHKYKGNVGYVGLKFMIGYHWKIPSTFLKDWGLEGKVGLSTRISTTDDYQDGIWRLGYERNDTLYLTSYGYDVAYFGKASKLGSTMIWSYTADFYIGLKREIDWSIVKDFSVGVSLTHNISANGGIANVHSHTNNFAGVPISEDEYRSQDFSLGLRMAVGLWYK